ncbi:hypothetical protein RND71_040920 [Anisodus tanguticus]|uniref:Uncharacterized protein n=1 Tax=Anisodus tanguticus TaxID=243964 RepID=A0AAE1UPD7_9SOLA|nr:hypothetical protein RND71_040920 [Anisodus tanguticus]
MAGVAVLQRVSYRQRRNSTRNPNPSKNRRNFSTSPPHLAMGEVKILKRGEVLTNQLLKENMLVEDLVLSTTDRPDRVPKQMNFYAGSAFVSSPPPSSLPVPAFFNKKTSDASIDLRRLLRLDLS